MSTLILDKVLSGYNLAKVNDNFERIEKAFNEALLHRDGSKELLDDLDVNSQKLLNVGGIEIGGVDIVESIASLQEEYNAYISTMDEYKAAVDEILEEAISYGAVDQKSIGNAQRVFTTSQTYAVNSNMTLPLPYIVGKNTLKLNLGHYYELYKGVDYEEVGVVGNQSTTIKLLRTISSGVEIEEFVDGDNDLYSIYATAEALQELLTTSYSPESIEEFVNSVSDIQELGLEDKIAQLNSLYESLVSLQTSLQTTVADINTKYSTITDMYEDVGTKYSLLETLYPQLLALLADTDFDLDGLNEAVGELNTAISDLNDLASVIEGYKDDAETAATSAENSASSASTSATSAANNASSAAGALTNAQIWAEGTDGQVANIGGEHSSKGWAEQAREYTVGSITEALGYSPADDSAVVKHTAQSLTNAQKAQARTNIDAFNVNDGITATGSTTAHTLSDWTAKILKQEQSNKPIVLVVAGQSNAAGRGEVASSYSLPSGKWWNGTAWVTGISDYVKSPIDSTWTSSAKGTMIPALAKTLYAKTGRNVYVIPLGVGGANCAVNKVADSGTWASNGTLRTSAKEQFNAALAQLSESYEIAGTVWLQGETDATWIANGSETLADYTISVTDTADWFLDVVGGRFFIIPIAHSITSGSNTYADAVNNVLANLAFNNKQASIITDVTKSFVEKDYMQVIAHYVQSGYDELGSSIGAGISSFFRGSENVTYKKRLAFKTPASFSDESAAITALSTASGQTITALFPQTATLCDGLLYVMYWGYTSAGPYSGHVLLVVFNYSTGDYVRYHILAGARNAEALVVKAEGVNKFVYVESTSTTIYRFQLNETNGSSLTRVNDGNEAISSGIFFSYRNGTWCVLNTSNQVSGLKPAGWSLYDDDWNLKRQIGWRPFEFDFLTDYSAQDANQMAIPHLQGVELGDDGLYLFKGGASNYDGSYPDVSAIGVQQMDFFGNIKRSSLCNSVQFRSAVSAVVGGTVSRSECEGGFITEDGRVFSIAVLDINSVRTITLFEEFSSSPDAVDFSACAFIPSNIQYLINTMQMPKGKDGSLYNPFTGEVLTGLADVIKMAYKFGLDRFVFNPYNLTTSPQEWTTLYGVAVCSDTAYSAEVVRNTGSTFFLRIRSSHNGGSSSMSSEYYVIVNSSGEVNYCQPSSFMAQMLRARRLYLGTSDSNILPLWNSNGTLQWNSNDVVVIVESSTNYKRYSDGTQECWGRVRNSSADGMAVTYPKEFSERPYVVTGIDSSGTNADGRYSVVAGEATATGFTAKVAYNNAATANGVYVTYFARGKWSA